MATQSEHRAERQRMYGAKLDKWCVMCGAAPGQPCTVISGDPDEGEKPGDVRAHPHFYRGSDTKPVVAVKDEPGYA